MKYWMKVMYKGNASQDVGKIMNSQRTPISFLDESTILLQIDCMYTELIMS